MRETTQFLVGTSMGVAIVLATLVASSASLRAGEMWAEKSRVRATALGTFAGISGVSALAGIGLGVVWVIAHSPLAG